MKPIDYKNKVQSLILYAKNKAHVLKAIVLSFREHIIKNLTTIFKLFIPFIVISIAFIACSIKQHTIANNIADIFSISDDIRTHFYDKPSYWRLSTAYILENNIIQKKYISNNDIKLKGNKKIFVGQGYPLETVAPNTKFFDIVLDGLNKAECISYLEAEISKANLVKLSSIKLINNSTNILFTWGDIKSPLPVKKYTGRSVCDNENNTIVWSMY